MEDSGDQPPGASALVQLEQLDERRFRATYNQDNFVGAIFGGQPLCQALAAAQRTVPGWPAHSCTGYFLRGGNIAVPVDYDVEIVRDGRRYAARRVLATQEGKPIFDMLCSFHLAERGLEHQCAQKMDVPEPETLVSVRSFVAENAHRLSPFVVDTHQRHFPIELRLLDPEDVFFGKSQTSRRDYWFRMPTADLVSDLADHQCLLAFMSDYWFAGAAGSVHSTPGSSAQLRVASVNHSLWIHQPVRVDEWLLFRTESPWGGDGRGLARGLIYDRAGTLVATAVQEITMALIQPKAD